MKNVHVKQFDNTPLTLRTLIDVVNLRFKLLFISIILHNSGRSWCISALKSAGGYSKGFKREWISCAILWRDVLKLDLNSTF